MPPPSEHRTNCHHVFETQARNDYPNLTPIVIDTSNPMLLSHINRRQNDPPAPSLSERAIALKASTTDPLYHSRHLSISRHPVAGQNNGRLSTAIPEPTPRNSMALSWLSLRHSKAKTKLELGYQYLSAKTQVVANTLFTATTADDLNALQTVVCDFTRALWIYTSLLVEEVNSRDSSSPNPHSNHDAFTRTVDHVRLAWNIFHIQVSTKDDVATEDDFKSFIRTAIVCLNVAVGSFRCVLSSAFGHTWKNKPLPSLPQEEMAADMGRPQSAHGVADDDMSSYSQDDALSVAYADANSVICRGDASRRFKIGMTRALERAKSVAGSSLFASSVDSTTTLVNPQSVETSGQRNTRLLRMLQSVFQTPLHPPLPKLTIMEPDPLILDLPKKEDSDSALGRKDATQSMVFDGRLPNPQIPHERASKIFYEDPDRPGVELEVALPMDLFDTVYNDDGDMVEASVSSLIRSVTSKDAIMDKDLKDVFFLMFRQFIKPKELFHKLVERYEEGPPFELTEAQQLGWEELLKTRRIRVTRIFLEWVDQHWNPETDTAALPLIRNFTQERIAPDIGGLLPQKLNEALLHCYTGGISYSGRRVPGYMNKYHEVCRLTGYTRKWMKLDKYDMKRVDILEFAGEAGCEELARQLTIQASKIFEELDTEEAVDFWRREKIAPIQKRLNGFEEAVCLWAEATILNKSSTKARAQVLDILYDVAIVRNHLLSIFCMHSSAVTSEMSGLAELQLSLRDPCCDRQFFNIPSERDFPCALSSIISSLAFLTPFPHVRKSRPHIMSSIIN
jgi:hypothetical protein